LKSAIVKIKTELNFSSKFTKDTFWLISSQIILIISGFLLNVIIGGKLGAENLGIFSQVISYYTILSTIFSLGLNNTIIQKIASAAQENNTENEILTSNLILTAIISVILTIASIALAYTFPNIFSSKELAEAIVIPFLSLPFFNLNKNFMAYYSGKRNQKMFSILRSTRWLLLIGFISISILVSSNLSILLYAFIFTEGSVFIFNSILLRKQFNIKVNLHLMKSNFSFGFKSFSAELLSVFNDQLDILIIAYFLTNSEVGIYGFLIFFAKSLYIFPGILQQNLNPIISNYWVNNKISELQVQLNKIQRINILVVLSQTFLVLIAYQTIIMLFKQEFQNSLVFLLIAISGTLPFALISWGGSMLVMTGKLKENTHRIFFILIFSSSTTFVLSYFFGLLGASIAVCLNSIITFLILKTFINKTLGLKLI
jgi:O-antigen/teichoic acid export membrane protein